MEAGRRFDAPLLWGACHNAFRVCGTAGSEGECSSALL